MVFTAPHIYWTLHWRSTDVPEEEGQIGFRSSSPGTPPTATTVLEVADAWDTFWGSTNAAIHESYLTYRVKAALIGVDGRYDPDFDPVIRDFTGVPGGVVADTAYFPLQVAHSLQLTTDRESGRAHAGRVYLPAISQELLSTRRWSIAQVNSRASAFSDFLEAVNVAIGTEQVQVMSALGAGTTRPVTGVRADDRPDVQRRRARQQPYTWGTNFPVS